MGRYQVKPGYRHGKNDEYVPGDVVELTDRQVAPILHKFIALDKPGADEAGVPVKVSNVSNHTVVELRAWLETNPTAAAVKTALDIEQNDKRRTSVIEMFTDYLGG